jgi:acetylglutamate kinase
LRIVVKIGGAALDDRNLRRNCAKAIAELAQQHQVAIVHGGGAALTRTLQKFGKRSEWVNGLRVTDAETRDAALMVLAGAVNKQLVAELEAAGQAAIGLCGGDGASFRAHKRTEPCDLGFVGEICAVDLRWIEIIWANHGVPVMASLALGVDGQYYNVNADQMAAACAAASKADVLIFLTDVPGVKDAEGAVLRQLSAHEIPILIEQAVIGGGMLPKLEACRQALRQGVSQVGIFPALEASALAAFCSGKSQLGTEVLPA